LHLQNISKEPLNARKHVQEEGRTCRNRCLWCWWKSENLNWRKF